MFGHGFINVSSRVCDSVVNQAKSLLFVFQKEALVCTEGNQKSIVVSLRPASCPACTIYACCLSLEPDNNKRRSRTR